MGKAVYWAWMFKAWALAALLASGAVNSASADPVKVTVGAFVANVEDVNFKKGQLTIDFYVWFRWQDDERLKDYRPLETVEVINGEIKKRDSVVEKTEGGQKYASARMTATVYKTWTIDRFPFDKHVISVLLEDSRFDAGQVAFEPDTSNSRLSEDVELAGWHFARFDIWCGQKYYNSNYGELGREYAQSSYSRATFLVEIQRDGPGLAVKLLTPVGLATLVAFVAFMVKPSNVDPRFGLGIGSLFAVAASALLVASAVPDSAVLTIVDKVHLLAMWLIFVSLVQSAFCLKWEEAGRHKLYRRVDVFCLVLFPLAFVLASVWIAWSALP